jgi:serine/threonine protein kinase
MGIMNCPEYEIIENYILDKLEIDKQPELKSHLESCPACKAKVEEARANENMLSQLRTFTEPALQTGEQDDSDVATIDNAQSILGERYRVIRKVGAGSAGQVFQVIDTVLERLVAVKFLRRKWSSDKTTSEAWHEARLMSQLNHPNIAQVYEIGEIERRRFIVMEWVDGPPLTEAWKGLLLQQRLHIFLGVLEAAAVAHERGIVHRDIKPQNILVTSTLKPKVLDFGIAIESRSLENTEQGLYRGTPAYSAPEQITPPVKIYPATDVFALGVLLYELLTDTLPFPQTDPKKLFEAIKTEYPELPRAIQEKVPIPLQNICLKSLEKDHHNRYANAQGLLDDINRYLRGEKVWSRPSFLSDKIQQEVFYHRQKLKVWQDNELLTQKEFDKLENIYERMIAPSDPSIIEARELSLSQVCLYLGGWIVVLGSFVLFYKSWEQISIYWRPTPAIIATALMIAIGLSMWRRHESRLAVGFLATANLLIPITILLTLAQWELLSAMNHPWGTESISQPLEKASSWIIIGNVQLYVSSYCWFAFSLLFLRITRSSIFVLFGIVAFLLWLTICYVITGMLLGITEHFHHWDADIIAGRYLLPGIGMFILGVILDRYRFAHYALPLCMTGLILIVACLSVIALSENTLFGWIWRKPKFLNDSEHHLLSFTCNGLIYLGLAGACRLLGTRLQRTLASLFNWLGPIHILGTSRILDLDVLSITEGHRKIYRTLLPIASFAFVFGSVARQMKSFFFSGLAGIAAAVHKFTVKHFDKFFAWPVSLIIAGITWMLVSWLVPRWKANLTLKFRK